MFLDEYLKSLLRGTETAKILVNYSYAKKNAGSF